MVQAFVRLETTDDCYLALVRFKSSAQLSIFEDNEVLNIYIANKILKTYGKPPPNWHEIEFIDKDEVTDSYQTIDISSYDPLQPEATNLGDLCESIDGVVYKIDFKCIPEYDSELVIKASLNIQFATDRAFRSFASSKCHSSLIVAYISDGIDYKYAESFTDDMIIDPKDLMYADCEKLSGQNVHVDVDMADIVDQEYTSHENEIANAKDALEPTMHLSDSEDNESSDLSETSAYGKVAYGTVYGVTLTTDEDEYFTTITLPNDLAPSTSTLSDHINESMSKLSVNEKLSAEHASESEDDVSSFDSQLSDTLCNEISSKAKTKLAIKRDVTSLFILWKHSIYTANFASD